MLASLVSWFDSAAAPSRANRRVDSSRVPEWVRFPELVWLDRFDLVVPVVYAVLLYGLGAALAAWAPALGTNGLQVLVWGYVVSTVALLTSGEGWHNNHLRYAGSARQGFYWWQPNFCYYLLRAMAAVGLIWGLKPVARSVLLEGRT